MKGVLYKITNTINGKTYIGKTYTTAKERFKRHIEDAFRPGIQQEYKYNFKFYKAIRKYGPSVFKIDILGKYDEGELEEEEIKAIIKYDTYSNGYNSTLGGDGNKKTVIDNDTRDKCIKLYTEGYNIQNIHDMYGIPHRIIAKIIKEANITRDNKSRSKPIIMIDKKSNIVIEFESMWEAYNWLKDNYNPTLDMHNAYYYMKKAALNGNTYQGKKWRFK